MNKLINTRFFPHAIHQEGPAIFPFFRALKQFCGCLVVFLTICSSAGAKNSSPNKKAPHNSSPSPIETIHQDSSPDPKITYGQLFIEETRKSDHFRLELSVSGGREGGNPYISSSFLGAEVKYRINSVLYLGLEYSFYDSSHSTAMKSIKEKMELYGLHLVYPVLDSAAYVNGHGRFFNSHLNLAGLFRIDMDFPVQFGMGLMNMREKGHFFSMKWGFGPRAHIGHQWGIQLLVSQSVSIGEKLFLYTWYSLNIIYSL